MPETPTYGLAGGYLSVRTEVRNLAKPVELLLRNTAVSPLSVEDGRPQTESLTASFAQWRFLLGLTETRRFQVGLRLPATSGTYTLDSTLRVAATPAGTPLASNQFAITVASPRDLATLLSRDLDALVLTHPPEKNARSRVQSLLSESVTAMQAKQRDAAISALLKALDELDKIESVDTTACHVLLSTLVKSARVSSAP